MVENRLRTLLDRMTLTSFELAKEVILKAQGVTTISFVNAHAVNLAYENDLFFDALESCDYLFRDGAGIELALKVLGRRCGDNNCGTDLIPAVLERCSGKRVMVFGSTNPILKKTECLLREKYSISEFDCLNGFDYGFTEYLDKLITVKPEILILAMGMPKQELISQQIKEKYQGNLTIICGGAILSFMTGEEIRSPVFLRKLRLEWLWRLINDPVRLFNRYVIGNVKFLYRLLITVKTERSV